MPCQSWIPSTRPLERLEWQDAKRGGDAAVKCWPAVTRRTALTGGAAGLAAAALAACGGGSALEGSAAAERLGGGTASSAEDASSSSCFVNHVTTNPFFVPTKYGAEDACKLLGCSLPVDRLGERQRQRDGQRHEHARSPAAPTGSRVALIDKKAFNAPTDAALKAKIPVVSYNADAASNSRLAYIGQDLFVSGQEMGKRIVELVRLRRRRAVHRDARLGQHPAAHRRRAGHAQEPGKRIKTHVIATGAALPAELSTIDSYASGHPDTKGTVRRRRRQHAGRRPDDPEAQPAREGRQGRRVRPHAGHAEAAGRRPDRLHDRPAALPAGLPADPAAVHVPGLGRR